MSAEPAPLRYFVDTNILGLIATRTHELCAGYMSIISDEQFSGWIPSISTVVAAEVEAGLTTLDLGDSTQRNVADAMRSVLAAFDHVDLDEEGIELASTLRIRARAAGHPLGAPSKRNDVIIAALAIRHGAPLVSHNYRDFVNVDALDLRTLAPIRKRPPRVRLEPGQ